MNLKVGHYIVEDSSCYGQIIYVNDNTITISWIRDKSEIVYGKNTAIHMISTKFWKYATEKEVIAEVL